jgi:hypothetical protein
MASHMRQGKACMCIQHKQPGTPPIRPDPSQIRWPRATGGLLGGLWEDCWEGDARELGNGSPFWYLVAMDGPGVLRSL